MIDYTFRPIDRWPGPVVHQRRTSPFRVTYGKTLILLGRELRHLDAKHVVIMLAVEEHEIRRDGLPRASARPSHPGVVLAFDSKYGPLKYATDVFTRWEDNLRAIGLGLEALRKVDRYGITKRGEQYTGWVAIPEHTGGSRAEAERLIASYGGVKEALLATHPDQGGDPKEFQRVQHARQLLAAT